jgi:BirA family biotin operon repressor/biotin-[acetyl-CoA-carboxylase] ligase
MTLIERPSDVSSLDVLPLRIGLVLTMALDDFSDERVRVKWPNDIYAGENKLAGVLVEARWRDATPAWIAIGVGINLRPPGGQPRAAGLKATATPDDVLVRVIPAVRSAAARRGPLDDAELSALAARDLALGRECREPVAGRVRGIDATGALLIEADGSTVAVRTGSLVLKEDL